MSRLASPLKMTLEKSSRSQSNGFWRAIHVAFDALNLEIIVPFGQQIFKGNSQIVGENCVQATIMVRFVAFTHNLWEVFFLHLTSKNSLAL